VSSRLLLDEMLGGAIAEQLRSRQHDVVAVVEDPSMTGLSDDEILANAAALGRAVVTLNIRDFVVLGERWRSAGRSHPGLVLVSTRTFPQDSAFIGALVTALDKLLVDDPPRPDTVTFLQR
jgi:predicted nuclease of predicted toxin-antitoxin system